MDPKQSRIGVLLAPTDALWAGTVSSYDDSTFTLTVTTTSGSLSNLSAGLAVVRTAYDQWARIRSVDSGAGTITLAENPIDYQASDAVTVYSARLPFPRYQRVTSGGDVYKDWSISFPGQYASMPPMAKCTPGVIVADVGASVALDASASAAMAVGASISTYTWTPGSGGTITGSGASVSVAYSTAGFRYLALTLTDSQGTAHTLYIPAWIGQSPLTDVSEARLTWRDGGGLVADLGLYTPPTFIQRTPVCLVDLDSDEVLFFGFMHPQNWDYDFEREALSFTALSPLAYLNELYSYPFLVETVGAGAASDWHQVYNLTLQRALWYLLYWHSTLPQIAGLSVPATARSIAGEKFSAGNLQQQLKKVCSAAFWQACGERDGGTRIRTAPLYDSGFSGLSTLTLDDGDVRGALQYSESPAAISEARLSGVYYDGGWEPLIVRAPVHPDDLGRPEEVTGLAPLNASELRTWAGRHLALARAREYSGRIWVDLDPATDLRVVLPDSVALGLESVSYAHDADKLAWDISFSGRTRGDDIDSADEPQPPDITIPAPDPPPLSPPIPFLPPLAEWPTTLYVATFDKGVYYTESFSGPDEGQPIWTPINTIDGGGTLTNCNVFHLADSGTQFVIDDNDSDSGVLYRRTTGNWFSVLTSAEASVLTGYATGNLFWVDSVGSTIYVLFKSSVSGSQRMRLLKSTDEGDNWVDLLEASDGKGIYTTNSLGSAVIYSASRAIFSAAWGFIGPKGKVGYNLTDIEDEGLWTYHSPENLGNGYYQWSCHYNPYDDIIYSNGENGGMFKVISGALVEPGASEDNLCAFVNEGWPRMAFDPDGSNEVLVAGHDEPLLENRIWKTSNNWSTKSTEGAVGREIDLVYTSPYLWGNFILARASSGDLSYPHTVFVTDDDGLTIVDKAGPSPDTSPYTNSIPRDCGGICWNGIGIVQ